MCLGPVPAGCRPVGSAGRNTPLPDDLFGPGATRPAPAGGGRGRWGIVLALAFWRRGWSSSAPSSLYTFPNSAQITDACRWLRCTVALPRMPDQLFIEASDLQVLNAARPGEVLLTATIRNRAAVTQELPRIELTLTDTLNQTAARKVFYPADYADKSQAQGKGSRRAGIDQAI